jgi:2-iminobutanoate/2-iminopropanoate deaminase
MAGTSTSREAIHTTAAPKPIGPYSQGLAAGGYVFFSGQIGVDPLSGKVADGVENQTRQVMENLAAVLAAAGCTFADVVKTTIYLVDMNDFTAVNAIYGESFESEPPPARSTVAVAQLPRGARIEIDAIAVRR